MYQVIKTFRKLGHYRNGFCVLLLFFFFFCSLNTVGQEFNTPWIYASQSDNTSHVWFRRAYISKGRPRVAQVTVTSTGYYKLYVNECNVGTALYYPSRNDNDTTALQTTFDITSYLRNDTNVVALLYSPVFPSQTQRQIAVSIYGRRHDGSAFSFASDDSWLCRRANSGLSWSGGEWQDGREHDPSWKAATINKSALWTHASKITACNLSQKVYGCYSAPKVSYIASYQSGDISLTQDSVAYSLQLPNGFYGISRATIRDARKKEEITIGNLHYICSGRTDEQAFPQFVLSACGAIPITGDAYFKPSQITFLETLSVE